MIKYIELHRLDNTLALIKVDAIRELMVDTNNHDRCMINGLIYKESYAEVKKLIMQDEHYEQSLGAAIKALMRNHPWELVKNLGETKALEFIHEIMDCMDEMEAYEIEMKHYST